MKTWQRIFFGIALFSGASYANECSDIAFEDPECVEVEGEVRCHKRTRAPRPSIEEEHLWEERSDSSWPAKRENFIDGFIPTR